MDHKEVKWKDSKLWYFAHPYSGENEQGNFDLNNERVSALLDFGYRIYGPITYCHVLHLVKHRDWKFWIDFDRPFMEKCDGLILAPGWENSKGCKIEYEYFQKVGKPILFYRELVKLKVKNK